MYRLSGIKNIFLDAGGVILDETDHEKLRAHLVTQLLKTVVASYSLEQYWMEVDEAVYRFVPSVTEYIVWKNTNDPALYRRLLSDLRNEWRLEDPPLTLVTGIETVLPMLATRYRVGILGQYGPEVAGFLASANLLNHFSFHDTQEQFPITKPDPRYFEQVLARAGASPTASLMVGDRIDKDVVPAKAIGMRTVRVVTGIHKDQAARTPEEMPDAEIHRLEQLLDLLPL